MKRAVAVAISMLVVMSYGGVWAKEDTEEGKIEVEIAFELTVEDRYPYEIRVSKGGSVYDGRQRITNGIQEYQLSVGEEKIFRIEANKGYQVERITINGKSIDKNIEKITIAGVSTRSILEVEYERIEGTSAPDPPVIVEESVDRIKPITGDRMPVEIHILWIMLALCGIYTSKRKTEIDTYKSVDDKEKEK